MIRDWQNWFALAILTITAGLVIWTWLTSSRTLAEEEYPAPIIPEPTVPSFPYVWHDVINGVTCYLWQGSIDCIPDSQLERR